MPSEYRRVGEAQAYVLRERRSWHASSGSQLTAEAGDWWVIDSHSALAAETNAGHGVAKEEFQDLYSPIEGRPGVYRREGKVFAECLKAQRTVATLEGEVSGRPGDWLVWQKKQGALPWVVPDETFRFGYLPASVKQNNRPIQVTRPQVDVEAGLTVSRSIMFAAGLATVIFGAIGWSQVSEDGGLLDWTYRAIALLVINYTGPSSPPLALQFGRFTGVAFAAAAVAGLIHTLLRERKRRRDAMRARGHVLILGDGPEVVGLALNYLVDAPPNPARRSVVVIGNLPPADCRQLQQHRICALQGVSPKEMAEVLNGAARVVISHHHDTDSVRLLQSLTLLSCTVSITALFDEPQVADFWNSERITALCRGHQVATVTLRQNPPESAGSISPPPIVVGDGTLAAIIARRLVQGWHEPGEPMTIRCLGEELGWVERVQSLGASRVCTQEKRVLLMKDNLTPVFEDFVIQDRNLFRDENLTRVNVTGARVYIVLESDSRATAIAASISHIFPDLEVIAVLRTGASAQPGERFGRLSIVSAQELLSDPEQLDLTAPHLLAEEIFADLDRWPDDLPSFFGSLPLTGAEPRLGEMPEAIRERLLSVAAKVPLILRRGGVLLGDPPGADNVILGPQQLTLMASYLEGITKAWYETDLDETNDSSSSQIEQRERALEFANELPYYAARAGFGVTPLETPCLGTEEIATMSRQCHQTYLEMAQQTANATGSPLSGQSWDEISEYAREKNRAQVRGFAVRLASIGLAWRRSAHPRIYALTDQQVEKMARLEHRRFLHFEALNGRTDHKWNLPWDELGGAVSDYDREPMRRIPQFLAGIGIEVYEPAEIDIVNPRHP